MPYAPLETFWGGTKQVHPPIVITPPNAQSDLIPTSEVLVQSFFSLHRHEYTYKGINNSGITGAYCAIRVDWKGPKVKWDAVSPVTPALHRMLSFFSPQALQTVADASVLAGAKPVAARTVAAERADAYVPWTASIPAGIKEVWSVVKDVLSKGEAVSAFAETTMGEGTIQIESMVQKMEDKLQYQYRALNRTESSIQGRISGMFDVNEVRNFDLPAGSEQRWRYASSRFPFEIGGFAEFKILKANNSQQGSVPVPFLCPGDEGDT